MEFLSSDLLEIEIYSYIKDTRMIDGSIVLDTNLGGLLELDNDLIYPNMNLELDRIKNSLIKDSCNRIWYFNYKGKVYDLQIFYFKPFNERYKVFCCGKPIKVIFDETDFFKVLSQKQETPSKEFAKDIYCYISNLKG
ncbi:hypothetical protein [Clostridium sp.]|uniref:hypothetical protein n=1 Tax=Clostridium sp. TaxID=1506 RepID=UPI002610B6E9